MEELIELYGKPTLLNSLIPETNLFDSLGNSIISQQLSVQVVKNIKRKLYELGAVEKFNPDLFITSSYEDLRNCGLSKAKCDYTKGLANRIKKYCIEKGMVSLREQGWDCVRSGITTPEEIVRITKADKF